MVRGGGEEGDVGEAVDGGGGDEKKEKDGKVGLCRRSGAADSEEMRCFYRKRRWLGAVGEERRNPISGGF